MANVTSLRSQRVWQIALAAFIAGVLPGFAQTPDPDAAATMRFGPLSMKSTLALNNIGVDTNVFNQTLGPQRDFTLTFTPTTDLWLRLGRTWINGTIKVDWVYFKRFASERGANSTYRIGLTRTLNRLAFKGNATHLNTRDRPGFEIDARSQRFEKGFDGEVTLRILPKTHAGVKGMFRETTFDKDAIFLGASLANELNRKSYSRAIVIRHDLTSLTNLSLDIGVDEDRFEFSPFRSADSNRVAATLKFQPLALINGEAVVGYRHFIPFFPDVPPYRGPIATTNLTYRMFGATRLGIGITRDVGYSVNASQPYFLETGVTASVQQRIFGPFDVLAKVGGSRIAYRDRIGSVILASSKVDEVRTFGAGAGYRLGLDKRVAFSLDGIKRRSNDQTRAFKGLRFGVSVTYDK